MLIYDDRFEWEGWGGALKLCRGECHLHIYDFSRREAGAARMLRPHVVVASEPPDFSPPRGHVAMRSMAGHIATQVCRKWNMEPQRMLYVEYYPASTYGSLNEHQLAERFEVADFQWGPSGAMNPRWRPLDPPLRDRLKSLLMDHGGK